MRCLQKGLGTGCRSEHIRRATTASVRFPSPFTVLDMEKIAGNPQCKKFADWAGRSGQPSGRNVHTVPLVPFAICTSLPGGWLYALAKWCQLGPCAVVESMSACFYWLNCNGAPVLIDQRLLVQPARSHSYVALTLSVQGVVRIIKTLPCWIPVRQPSVQHRMLCRNTSEPGETVNSREMPALSSALLEPVRPSQGRRRAPAKEDAPNVLGDSNGGDVMGTKAHPQQQQAPIKKIVRPRKAHATQARQFHLGHCSCHGPHCLVRSPLLSTCGSGTGATGDTD